MTTKIKLRSYIIKLCSILILFISVTFCWFVFTQQVSVSKLQIKTVGILNVTISNEEQKNWTDKLKVDSLNGTVTEFSGNGKKLYSPITSNFEVVGFNLEEESLNFENDDKEFIEIVTYIKTDGPINFYLGQNSTVTPNNSNIKNEAEREKLDLIAGAIRVAIIVEDYKPFIWVPNTTYQYDEVTKTYIKNGTPEDKFTYVYSETNSQFLETTDVVTIDNSELLASGVSTDKRFVWGDLSNIENYLKAVEPIFSTDVNLKEEIIVKMVIRIWVEGTDREAVKSVIGGKFTFNLDFVVNENTKG